ncbi:MAG: DNA ligase D [Rhizobiales bacterium]|nr:DNA ligase D [Hyphomicrobiales bacterium]
MALDVYRKKRKFGVTPEPRGRKARAKGSHFVIQKHAATRLHYDLRLELDGVMKSWAVTRGPSLVPGEKRLAVEVEDHPVEYNTFEGTIPKGEYGGGTVLIWDRGTWIPEEDPHRGLKKGHLDFSLQGEKLAGHWHLVRMHRRPGEKRNNWLLIKANDENARTSKDADILEEMPESVVSGRSIEEIAEGKGKKRVWHSNRSVADNVKAGAARAAPRPEKRTARGGRKSKTAKSRAAKSKRGSHNAALPDFVPPSLATLHDKVPQGSGWVHEIKFDGYRIQARLDHGKVKLLTRKGLDWVARFPNVAADVARLAADTALIDGEIAVENSRGLSDFSMLQAALSKGEQDSFVYYVFDLLHLDGVDLSGLPLVERKATLKELLEETGGTSSIRYSEHFTENGKVVWKQASQMGLEGIVSKRADAPYRPGRTDSFMKIKCATEQEFVIGGYGPSNAMPDAVGALVVGYYRDGRLIYAGRVGTGYTRTVAKELWKRLHPLERTKTPFDEIPPVEARRRDVRWVEPTTVIESHFRGWTSDGIVRQAAFKGVRDDKPAKEVFRELPAEEDGTQEEPRRAAAKSSPSPAKKSKRVTANKSRRTFGQTKRATGRAPQQDDSQQERAVRFTHPDRVYWPDIGVTKQELADYYTAVWDWMAPQVVNYPLSLLRCPDGAKGECFFQKHASAGLNDKMLKSIIDSKRRQVIAVQDLNGLLSLVQAGVLEVHVRGSTIDQLDLCHRIIFDIDPGPGIGWADIVRAAREVRERLAAIDLECFVKLSGGKGVHVVLPVAPVEWATVKTFVQAFAQAMAADDPDRYVAKMTKSIRKGKIFVDYLRNSLEQTAVAAYSTRARDGAPVSAPVTWDELGRVKSASQYTLRNLGKRLGSLKRDPWADIGRVKQRLPDLRSLRKRG